MVAIVPEIASALGVAQSDVVQCFRAIGRNFTPEAKRAFQEWRTGVPEQEALQAYVKACLKGPVPLTEAQVAAMAGNPAWTKAMAAAEALTAHRAARF